MRLLGAMLVMMGCGARTGLPVPDLGLDAGVPTDLGPDAAVDLGMDAAVPCVDLPFDGGPVEVALETEARVLNQWLQVRSTIPPPPNDEEACGA